MIRRLNWYWGRQIGRRHGQSVWYGVSCRICRLQITLLYVHQAKVTKVTAAELYERLR